MKIHVSWFLAALGLTLSSTSGHLPSETDQKAHEFRKLVENSPSDNPTRGLGYDWLDCLERFQTETDKAARKVVCHTWTAQGVTSTLFALKFGNDRVPVVESRLEGASDSQRIVVDVQGGPGGLPFYSNPAMTKEFVKKIRRNGMLEISGGAMEELPQYQVMKRGFTIASIGYWGMNIRTLHEQNEIKLAIRDVQLAVDYYRDQIGDDPPLIITSLGNHLALGALGQERLQEMNFLSLVPVMEGLQHHLSRTSEKKLEADATEKPFGSWHMFNIYKHSGNGVAFDHSRMLPFENFVRQYIGGHDLPWHEMSPKKACSRIVLGNEDPRTTDYLAANENLPQYVLVWDSDHDLYKDALPQFRTLFADYAECLIEGES